MADEDAEIERIEGCRRVNRRAAALYAQQGIPADLIAIAGIYSAVDLATHTQGHPAAAIAWARRALDVMEEGLPLTSETIQ